MENISWIFKWHKMQTSLKVFCACQPDSCAQSVFSVKRRINCPRRIASVPKASMFMTQLQKVFIWSIKARYSNIKSSSRLPDAWYDSVKSSIHCMYDTLKSHLTWGLFRFFLTNQPCSPVHSFGLVHLCDSLAYLILNWFVFRSINSLFLPDNWNAINFSKLTNLVSRECH